MCLFFEKIPPIPAQQYDRLFKLQVRSVHIVRTKWRARVWTDDYYQRFKKVQMEELEAAIVANPLDLGVRRELAYFAKRKWRGLFLYEEAQVIRVQRWARECDRRYRFTQQRIEQHRRGCAWRRGGCVSVMETCDV